MMDEAKRPRLRKRKEGLRQLFGNLNDRTVFFITHRLSTIRQADMIVMLHEGAVVEVGT